MKDLLHHAACDELDGSELDIPADGSKEWNIVDKENISTQHDNSITLQNLWWDLHVVHLDRHWAMANCLAFDSSDVGYIYLLCTIDVTDGDRAILYQVVMHQTLEVME